MALRGIGRTTVQAGPSRLPSLQVSSAWQWQTYRRTIAHTVIVTTASLHVSATWQSGSNKWSKIKHTKEKNDSKRGTGYSVLSREIIAAVRNHPTRSTSTDTNPKLSLLFRRAKLMDVSRDKLEATLKKAESMGTASADGQQVTYEALGPVADNGLPVALIVECQTDSPARTFARVKEAFNKHAIRLSSTEHMFQRKGLVRLLARPGTTFDSVFDVAVEHGAEDVREWEAADADAAEESDVQSSAATLNGIEIECSPSDLVQLTSALSSEPQSHTIVESQNVLLPVASPLLIRGVHDEEAAAHKDDDVQSTVGWLGDEDLIKLDKVLDMLQENADCTRVWSNIEGWPSR